MAVAAAPFVVAAAEAVSAAIAAAGSALAAAVGIKALSEAIDDRFSKEEPSAVQPCAAAEKPVDFEDPASVEGKDSEAIEKAAPED